MYNYASQRIKLFISLVKIVFGSSGVIIYLIFRFGIHQRRIPTSILFLFLSPLVPSALHRMLDRSNMSNNDNILIMRTRYGFPFSLFLFFHSFLPRHRNYSQKPMILNQHIKRLQHYRNQSFHILTECINRRQMPCRANSIS